MDWILEIDSALTSWINIYGSAILHLLVFIMFCMVLLFAFCLLVFSLGFYLLTFIRTRLNSYKGVVNVSASRYDDLHMALSVHGSSSKSDCLHYRDLTLAVYRFFSK